MENVKVKIQRFGNTLSAMVMPNIGAFIAWGILAALFIPAGYFPNEKLNSLIGPTLTYVLPILIGYTAGYNIYGKRGGVAGVLATVGVIVGSDVTMLIGGMVMGPIGALTIRKIDKIAKGRVKSGLEMLVDNFTLGILGAILMVVGLNAVAPVYNVISSFLMSAVNFLSENNIIQLSPVVVVPGQLLFLNNAINHGILSPLGIEQAAEFGKSILFLVESNGGPWTGLAFAFAVFGRGMAKKSAPGAAIIQLFGGIGEVVFPYALTKPITMLGPIIGQVFALYWFSIFGGGTVAAVSPGSFIALIMMSPKDGIIANVSGYIVSGLLSFAIVGFLLKRSKNNEELVEYDLSTEENSSVSSSTNSEDQRNNRLAPRNIQNIYFACDAGMGSSVMAASILTTQLQKNGVSLKVNHVSLSEVPKNADLIVTSDILYERALTQVAEDVPIIKIHDLMSKNEHSEIAKTIKDMIEQNK
ncbi:PTS system, mannitol-specific IIB component [Enterococcus sp. DIV2402]|uniref:PTS system, mannitol-specific IIB component n=1 Tax=Candidatus Enterococcus lowellii TaxID=2230877 RepID=A0ABZ2SQB0_9ENTE|nr:PTS mannitol transporter subunit IICB [Enterococcus sp. DIV2402]